MDLSKLYATQISITEWFERINHAQTAELRDEDNKKRERLEVIRQVTGMSYDKPTQFAATDIAGRTPEFQKFLAEHGDELCALRLIPQDSSLPKLRMRGKTVRGVLDWFAEQQIDPTKYTADFVPHAEGTPQCATIFIVNKDGIFGEITKGTHAQLTQGFYDQGKPVVFSYNFKTWQITDPAPEYKRWLQEITKWLHIPDKAKQATLQQKLHAKFAHDYLLGYFETITNADGSLWYIDYNRLLGDMFQTTTPLTDTKDALLTGRSGNQGKVTGTVKIVAPDKLDQKINSTDILVCAMTSPDYLPLMQQAAAIVTEMGGVLSHAAIIARELKKPCITGVVGATTKLKDGQKITVDATNGAIYVA